MRTVRPVLIGLATLAALLGAVTPTTISLVAGNGGLAW
jgi:hypothetical protein